jgi:hypothetical protein
MTQRIGNWSRLILYPEGTWNSDSGITTGYVLPLVDQSGFGDSQDPIQVPIYTGDVLPFDDIPGLIQSGGDLPLGLEYLTIGYLLKSYFGANGYLRPGAGAGSEHQFFIPTIAGSQMGSFQLQSEFLEPTAQYLRGRGIKPGAFNWQGEVSGFNRYGVSVIGSGSMPNSDLAGSKINNGFAGSNYFDGSITYQPSGGSKTTLADVVGFRCRLFNSLARQDAFFNAGQAASVNGFQYEAEGALALQMQDSGAGPAGNLNFYNDAVNRTIVTLDVIYANGPLQTCTSFLRFQLAALRYFRMAPRPGGSRAIMYEQAFRLVRGNNVQVAGEYMLPTLGTFNIGPTTNKLGIKVDGGATQTVTLTQGATRTTDQVVTDIAALPLVGAAADNYAGRVRISSNTKGATSSIQIDTAVANSGHTLFGADGTARAGKDNCPFLGRLFNTKTSDY